MSERYSIFSCQTHICLEKFSLPTVRMCSKRQRRHLPRWLAEYR